MSKLEEQIRELFEDLNDQVFRDADYEKGELVTKGQLLHEIVESAKKEFPMKDKNGKRVWSSKDSKRGNILFDVMEWFERWFMNSANEAKNAEK